MLKNLIIASALTLGTPLNAGVTAATSRYTNTWYDTIGIWKANPNNNEYEKELIRQKTAFRNQNISIGGADIYQKAIEYQTYVVSENYLVEKLYTVTKVENTAYSLNEIKMDFTSTVNNVLPTGDYTPYIKYKFIKENDLYDPDGKIETFLTTNNYRDSYDELMNLEDLLGNSILSQGTTRLESFENLGTYTLDINLGNIPNNIYIISESYQAFDTTNATISDIPIQNYANVYETTQFTITYRYENNESGEIVDIPGTMFTILGMPFAFLSQAFDLTVFPNTMYAVNISHIFVALISALILIVVIKKILK